MKLRSLTMSIERIKALHGLYTAVSLGQSTTTMMRSPVLAKAALQLDRALRRADGPKTARPAQKRACSDGCGAITTRGTCRRCRMARGRAAADEWAMTAGAR